MLCSACHRIVHAEESGKVKECLSMNWDYLAGWFDSSGWIGKSGDKSYSIILIFSSIDPRVIEGIKEFVRSDSKIAVKDRDTPLYSLRVSDHNTVLEILDRLKDRCITHKAVINSAIAKMKMHNFKEKMSDEKIILLKENYGKMSNVELGKMLNVGRVTVTRKAKELGIYKSRRRV